MADQLKQEQFVPLVNTGFRVYDGAGNTYSVTLVTVTDVKRSPVHEEYILHFHGAPEFFLPQGIYGFEHDAITLFDLFIVPIAKDDGGYTYEAVFSRLTTAP